jgi:hypothetical protein
VFILIANSFFSCQILQCTLLFKNDLNVGIRRQSFLENSDCLGQVKLTLIYLEIYPLVLLKLFLSKLVDSKTWICRHIITTVFPLAYNNLNMKCSIPLCPWFVDPQFDFTVHLVVKKHLHSVRAAPIVLNIWLSKMVDPTFFHIILSLMKGTA